jgi:hypothetical protein
MSAIDPLRTSRLLSPGDAEGARATTKGRALEKAIRYVFECIPGISCSMQDQRGAFDSEEVDLLFANLAHEDGLVRFEAELLVEAKNWSSKVGAIEICWFATKMRRRNCSTGVLVAAQGVTGDKANLSAARAQIMLALNEGQRVLVLTRAELEAVTSGTRLADLLHKKLDHLKARQDIYIADPKELRGRRGVLTLGSDTFAAMLRGERTRRIAEALARKAHLPDGDQARANRLRQGLQEVQRLIEERRLDAELDPMWDDVREALLDTSACAVAWLEDLDLGNPEVIRVNAAARGIDRLQVSAGSAMWQCLTDYYVDQLASGDPERPRDSMLIELVGMLIEEIWKIDEYVPEPEYA